MDIIVTTPKSEMAAAAQEVADCIAAAGGEYFRRFPRSQAPKVATGDRVYYVEDGYIRGFALVSRVEDRPHAGVTCDTTRRPWLPGFYVFMDAASWQWIRPIPMRGFQGWRHLQYRYVGDLQLRLVLDGEVHVIDVVGGWRDPRPEVGAA